MGQPRRRQVPELGNWKAWSLSSLLQTPPSAAESILEVSPRTSGSWRSPLAHQFFQRTRNREIAQHRDYSEATAVKIDEEVQKLVKRGYDTAKELLSANRDVLVRIALALIEREVLDAQQIKMIIEGQELPKIVPPPKPDDGVQQVIKPDLQPGRAKGGERPAPA
jgi:hypothetical protein